MSRRTRYLIARVTADDWNAVARRAAEAGLSMSDFLRAAVGLATRRRPALDMAHRTAYNDAEPAKSLPKSAGARRRHAGHQATEVEASPPSPPSVAASSPASDDDIDAVIDDILVEDDA
jgi:hypothetical protein